MRVLGFAISEIEPGAEFPSFVDEEKECRGCPALKRMEEIRCRRGRELVDRMLEGVLRALEKNVRTSDQVLLRPCGQIDLVLANADERRVRSVLQRLRTRMNGFWGPHVLEISSVVTIREGKKATACESVMRAGTRQTALDELQSGGSRRSMKGER